MTQDQADKLAMGIDAERQAMLSSGVPAVMAMANANSKLKMLRLDGVFRFTDAGLESIVGSNAGPGITPGTSSAFPWKTVLIGGGVVLAAMMLFKKK